MESKSNEEDQKLQKQINIILKPLHSQQASFKQYCFISEKALELSVQKLIEIESKGDKKSRPRDGNHQNIVEFLLRPNVLFAIPKQLEPFGNEPNRKEEAIRKQKESIQAGQRIIDKIAYAWSYYVRMAKGYLSVKSKSQEQDTSSQTCVYNEKNIAIARDEVGAMLREMRNAKFHWENYTPESLKDWDDQRREIEEEQVFTTLLSTTLVRQIDKIDRLKMLEGGRGVTQPSKKQQIQDGEAEEDISGKKSISQLIDVKGYFQSRKKRQQAQKPAKDPISQLQERRKFNAAVLRYSMAGSK